MAKHPASPVNIDDLISEVRALVPDSDASCYRIEALLREHIPSLSPDEDEEE